MAQRAPLSLDSVSPPPPAGPPPQENGRFPGLLFEVAPAAQDTGQRDEDRSFAADLNLGQIAGDRGRSRGARPDHDGSVRPPPR
jgi:hypothetical protein